MDILQRYLFQSHFNLTLDTTQESTNSPANDYWTLYIQYTKNNEILPTTIPITFNVTGEVDTTRTSKENQSTVEKLLAPTILLIKLRGAENGIDVDFWKLLNWVIVGYYWTILNDLGQVNPTVYAPIPPQPLPSWYQMNFTQGTRLASTNNIFTNSTLYHLYSTYLNDTILPVLNYSARDLPVNLEIPLQPQVTTFVRSYNCQIRQWKAPFEAFVSIVTTIYVFVTGAYSFFIFVSALLEKHFANARGQSFVYII